MNCTGKAIWAFIMVLGVSSMSYGELYPKENVAQIIKAQREAIKAFDISYINDFEGSDSPKTCSQRRIAMKGENMFSQRSIGKDPDLSKIRIEAKSGDKFIKYFPGDKSGLITRGMDKKSNEIYESPLDYAMMFDAETTKHHTKDLLYQMRIPKNKFRESLEEVNGVKCAVLECSPKRKAMLLYLDPEKGFAVVRRETYDPSTNRLKYSIDNLEFKQVCSGVWIPTKSQKTKYDESGEKKYTYFSHVKDIKVNDEVDDELFEFTFPDGTLVTDTIVDISYVYGAQDIKTVIEDHLTEFQLLEDSSKEKIINDTEIVSEKTPKETPKVNTERSIDSQKKNVLPFISIVLFVVVLLITCGSLLRRRKER